MATNAYVWRTGVLSGTEGTNTIFVDSFMGSDTQGKGTRALPYRTLGQAWGQSTKPAYIVCRGVFSESMIDDTQKGVIYGDYYGAAVFDGLDDGSGVGYMLHGFTLSKMIVKNVPGLIPLASTDSNKSAFAGVGRAYNAIVVGYTSAAYAHSAYGVAAPSASIHKSALYWGIIGGNTAAKYIVYDSPVHNSKYKISLGTGNEMLCYTVYNVALDDIRKSPLGCTLGSYKTTFKSSVFGKFPFIINDGRQIQFIGCTFASDCDFYYFSGIDATSAYEKFDKSANWTSSMTHQQKGAALLTWLNDLYESKAVAAASRFLPSFDSCIFSDQTSYQIFNDPDNGDFTLIPHCDAHPLSDVYYGAMPPALHVKVVDNSDGMTNVWDTRTKKGCMKIEDGTLLLDEASSETSGEILSKVMKLDIDTMQLKELYSMYENPFAENGSYLNGKDCFGDTYTVGDTVGAGTYIVLSNGGNGATVDGTVYADGAAIIYTDADGSKTIQDGSIRQVTEPNMGNTIYARLQPGVFTSVGTSDALKPNGTYFNDSGFDITYGSRTVKNGESFIADDGTTWSCPSDSTAKLAEIFDCDNSADYQWIPLQMFGTIAASKSGTTFAKDSADEVYASGNYNFWKENKYQQAILARFIQFKVVVQRYE